MTLPDGDDLAELRGFAGWGDANAGDRPAPQLQLSALLADPPELRPRLLLEGQARRLGLRVLPDVASSSLRAYLVASGVRPTVEEYFVDDVYRTAFDKDDYSSIQLEVLLKLRWRAASWLLGMAAAALAEACSSCPRATRALSSVWVPRGTGRVGGFGGALDSAAAAARGFRAAAGRGEKRALSALLFVARYEGRAA